MFDKNHAFYHFKTLRLVMKYLSFNDSLSIRQAHSEWKKVVDSTFQWISIHPKENFKADLELNGLDSNGLICHLSQHFCMSNLLFEDILAGDNLGDDRNAVREQDAEGQNVNGPQNDDNENMDLILQNEDTVNEIVPLNFGPLKNQLGTVSIPIQ